MLDLRIKRLVQIVHVISNVGEAEVKIRRAEIQWQTRALASFIAATVEDNKAAEKLIAEAGRLSMGDEDDGPADTPGDSRTDSRSLDEVMTHGNTQAALRKNLQRKGPGLPFMN